MGMAAEGAESKTIMIDAVGDTSPPRQAPTAPRAAACPMRLLETFHQVLRAMAPPQLFLAIHAEGAGMALFP